MQSFRVARREPETPEKRAVAHEPGSEAVTLVFCIADRRCALALEEIREITHLPELVRPAGLPAPVVGFFSLGGIPVPVVDGGRLMGVPDVVEALYSPLIVLRCGESMLALMVDGIEGVVATRISGALDETSSLNGCARALAETPDGPVQVLGADRILLAAERDRLAALSGLAHARLSVLETFADAR